MKRWAWLLALSALSGIAHRNVTAQDIPPSGSGFFRSFDPAEPSQFPNPYAIRWGLSHSLGRGVGIPGGYTTLEAFVPLDESAGSSLLFADLRGHIDDFGNPAANVGFGQRYLSGLPAVFGWSMYYDYRNTANDFNFHQLGVGAEILTDFVELRANAYTAEFGNERQELAARFLGNNLIDYRAEVAMNGVDFEAGVVLPPLGPIQAKVFGGGYFFENDQVRDVRGWRARAELSATENLSAGVSVQDDDVFGSTVLVSVTLRSLQEIVSPVGGLQYPTIDSFRRGDEAHLTRSVEDRLADPIYRQPFVVTGVDQGRAVSSAVGMPFHFLHVVGSTSPGGNGTIERPFQTLSQAMTAAGVRAGREIVYTPFGGTYLEDVILPTDLQLLGNGVSHTVTDFQFGPRLIPFSAVGQSSVSAARIVGNVTVATNTELDGFNITGGVLSAGAGLNQVLVERNRVTNAGGVGILLTGISNAAGTPITVQDNVISNGAATGIRLEGTTIFGTVADNTANSTTTDGLRILATNFNGTIGDGNTFMGTAGDGIDVVLTGLFSGDVLNNVVSVVPMHSGTGINIEAASIAAGSAISGNTASNAGTGIHLKSATSIAATIMSNTASTTTDEGLFVEGASYLGTISGNTFSGSKNKDGMHIVLTGAFTGSIASNTTSANKLDGINLLATTIAPAIPNGSVISGNTSSSNQQHGIELHVIDATGKIENNITDSNALHGIFIAPSGLFRSPLLNNQANSNKGSGIAVVGVGEVGNAVMPGVIAQGNTLKSNGGGGIANGNFGLIFDVARLNGTIGNNTFESNTLEGASIRTTGAGASDFIFDTNAFSMNNSAGTKREFVFNNSGPGLVDLLFDHNSSSTTVIAPNFNFDVLKAIGAGGVTVMSSGNNTGTPGRVIGSSDTSVPGVPSP